MKLGEEILCICSAFFFALSFNIYIVHNLLVRQEKHFHPLLQFHRKLLFLLILEAPLHSPVQIHTDILYSHTASDGGYGCMNFKSEKGG